MILSNIVWPIKVKYEILENAKYEVSNGMARICWHLATKESFGFENFYTPNTLMVRETMSPLITYSGGS